MDIKTEDLVKKVREFKESEKIDLSYKEDLGVAIMNLVGMEEHLFFTYNKTGKEKYLDLLNEIRGLRTKYLAEIVKNPEGEIWCISKHLLAASMRLMEAGTKKLKSDGENQAKELFDKSYELWNIFWGINLNLIELEDIKSMDEDGDDDDDDKNHPKEHDDKEKHEPQINLDDGKKVSVFSKLGKIVQHILDCCKE